MLMHEYQASPHVCPDVMQSNCTAAAVQTALDAMQGLVAVHAEILTGTFVAVVAV
jgi:hypothetical protein